MTTILQHLIGGFLRLASRGARNASGQITLSIALLALPLCLAAGSALDYGMLLRAKSGLQSAIDSATLAAAAKQGVLDDREARSYFAMNASLSGITVEEIHFTKQDDGTVAGNVTAKVPAMFMRILRRSDYIVRLKSSARGVFPTYHTRLVLSAVSAKGPYDKDIYFTILDPSGRILRKAVALYYDYTYNPVTRAWTGKWGPTPMASDFQWKPGEDVGLMMVVYRDKTGLGQKVNPDVMTSEDADYDTFVKFSGYCNVGAGMNINWEDSRDRFGDFKDFVTTMTCAAEKVGGTNVRLTK